ncbi:MAG: DUF3857 domain-containing protein [Acidobacteriota bacterium]
MRNAGRMLMVVVAGVAAAHAATINRRSVEILIDHGEIHVEERLEIQIETAADVEEWNAYGIPLNENQKLVSCSARYVNAKGRTVGTVRRSKNRRRQSVGSDLYSSRWVSVIPLPDLEMGQTLEISYTVVEEPYYETAHVLLGLETPQKELVVRVTTPLENLRWRVEGDATRFEVARQRNGLSIHSGDIPGYTVPEQGPSYVAMAPGVRLSWSKAATWRDVGLWYETLVTDLPAEDEVLANQARSLLAADSSPPDSIEALARYVREKVRYEAVEIGIGGFRPSPGQDVVHRGWGDCKDKAHLLSKMLGSIGIPSHMVLISSGTGERVDPEFPDPFQFNHAILAVPERFAGPSHTDAVVDGFLLIDPTWERGTNEWLPPSDRGRSALLIDGRRSRLIDVPELATTETAAVELHGEVAPSGDIHGTLSLRFTGEAAVSWQSLIGTVARSKVEQIISRQAESVLPGTRLSRIVWENLAAGIPGIEIRGEVEVPRFITGRDGRRHVRSPHLTSFPSPRLLDDRTVPVVLAAGRHSLGIDLDLPENWCPVEPRHEQISNALGIHSIEVSPDDGGGLHMRRESTIWRSWVAPADFDDLRALAQASLDADRRPQRLRCNEPGNETASGNPSD